MVTFPKFALTRIDVLMRVVAKKIPRKLWEKHADSDEQLKTWFKEASKAIWTSPNVIKDEYPIASVLRAGRGVFNICVISTD